MSVIKSTGLLTKGIRSEFFAKMATTPQEWVDLAMKMGSTSDHETHKWLGNLPAVREWGRGRLARGMSVEEYIVKHLKYELTLEVDRDEIDDDQTGQIKIRAGEMGIKAGTHKDYLITQLMINGATTGYNSYDGTTFFAADHVSGSSGSQDNDLTRAIVAADAPTVAECRTALDYVLSEMAAFVDDQGEPLYLSDSGIIIVCHRSKKYTWKQAVGDSSQTDNFQGGVRVTDAPPKVISLPWLTDESMFYVFKTDGVVKPFIFQDRGPAEFKNVAEGSEEAFRTEKYLYGWRDRYRMTYGLWQHAIRCNFTTT